MTSFAVKAGAAVVGVGLLGAGAAAGLTKVITGDWEAAKQAVSNIISNDQSIVGCVTRDNGIISPQRKSGKVLDVAWVVANADGDTCVPSLSSMDGQTWPMLDGKGDPSAGRIQEYIRSGTIEPDARPDITFKFNDETVMTVDNQDYFIEGVVPANTDISTHDGQITIELEGQEPVTVGCTHAVITPTNTVTAGLSCGMR